MNKAMDDGDEDLPWETLRYLIGEAMYGGRVTDDFDRRIMSTYLDEYLGNFIFDKNQKFYFSRAGFDYTVPGLESQEQYLEYIETLPIFTNPNVFGLHTNAEIIYFTNAAKSLWFHTITMQSSGGDSAGGQNREEYVSAVA